MIRHIHIVVNFAFGNPRWNSFRWGGFMNRPDRCITYDKLMIRHNHIVDNFAFGNSRWGSFRWSEAVIHISFSRGRPCDSTLLFLSLGRFMNRPLQLPFDDLYFFLRQPVEFVHGGIDLAVEGFALHFEAVYFCVGFGFGEFLFGRKHLLDKFDAHDNLQGATEEADFLFDENRYVAKKMNPSGKVISQDTFVLDIRQSARYPGKGEVYTEQGELAQNIEGNSKYTFEYRYDDQGNWVEKKRFLVLKSNEKEKKTLLEKWERKLIYAEKR